jgi:hypothetical protein
MKDSGRLLWLSAGIGLGVVGAGLFWGRANPALAYNDRHADYVMCTGRVSIMPAAQTDGVWLLDYRSGKLLATIVNRPIGKMIGWAEVDLLTEFGLAPRQDVHFLMTTGSIAPGQAALYVAETTSGKFAVYTMGPRPDSLPGLIVRRHDLVSFRPEK